MRYSAIYVDSVGQWGVIDALSDGFVLEFFDTEKDARLSAKFEEYRWNQVRADALPVAKVS